MADIRAGRRRTRIVTVAVLLALALLVAGCAAGQNDVSNAHAANVAGFWLGLWQGLISPITFLISLFDDHVGIYEVHNNGNWYDFGFMLGVAVIFSGPARLGGWNASRRSTRRRDAKRGEGSSYG